jgi:hypothetical protein
VDANARRLRAHDAPHHEPRRPRTTTATARSYVDAIVLGPDNRTGVEATGFYDDEFARSDDWKIAVRSRWCGPVGGRRSPMSNDTKPSSS